LVVTHLAEEIMRERAATAGRRFGIDVVGAAKGASVIQIAAGRAGCLAGREASSFAPARVLALDGAEMLVCFEPPEDLPLLRTRAMENRVFLAGVGPRWGVIVGPAGEVLAEAGPERPGVAEIDLAAAGDKTVAPGTDIFDERRVALYRF
jgi:predicted amidohydrolase